jgi:predicted XRE-type DNA-binding protein
MVVKIQRNIFAETGVKEPGIAQLKAQLVQTIIDIFTEHGYKQKDASSILNVKQPVISDLVNGKLHKFTIDRLLYFLFQLDWQVTIETNKKPRKNSKPIVFKRKMHYNALT